MLRVTTLHASCASATAPYYARYLTAAPGEAAGLWSGRQAAGLGLSGRVEVDALESLLSGRDPTTGIPLGRELLDRYKADGRVVRAVSGYDATFSAPKSLSVWWALTGDHRLLDAHDAAVTAALAHLERFGSTTRIRSDGARLHPDTNGLTIAVFRQTTSRADDPQIHTHAVISAKVQTPDGRWYALDARYLKRHQRVLGGLYQSVLRAELSHRFGVEWRPITNGQAEIAGVPDELLRVFSKRSGDINRALDDKLDDFRQRHGREPSRWERAALTREASADTRSGKSGHGVPDLTARWRIEAAHVGWTADLLGASIADAATAPTIPADPLTVSEVIEALSQHYSSWTRADVLRAICDVQRPVPQQSGCDWADTLERSADRVLALLVDLDPPGETTRRTSDGRSVWIAPTAGRFTSEPVLVQEEAIIAWAMAAQAEPPAPSTTINPAGLDPSQADAAAAVAGKDRVVLVVGPAGAGKTRMLTAAGNDLQMEGRRVLAVAPTAKAARTVERDTGIRADTVAKLLHEWHRTDRPPIPEFQLPAGATLIVDEAGMLSTPALHQVISLADRNAWRLALVGDPQQLHGVGRSGLLAELCANGRVEHLERLHRFTLAWEATASLQLREGDLRALAAYEAHGRIVAGTLDAHLARVAATWIDHHDTGRRIAVVASTNDHVDTINHAIQTARRAAGHLEPAPEVRLAGGQSARVGDVIATRRNDRRLITSSGQPVRNRDTWTVTAVDRDGSILAVHDAAHGNVTLPADYVCEHVRLGYAATEHGWQSDTVDTAIALVSPATSRRGLYVAATRGAERNIICVVTESGDIAEATDVLEAILATDRADVPATAQRRILAESPPHHVTRTTPATSPRCEIPGWFNPVLDQARRALLDGEARDVRRATRRAHATVAATEADHVLAAVTAATAADRDALRRADASAAHARSRHAAAHNRLLAAPRRQRRSLRREVEVARQQLDRTNAHLERTRERTAPAVESHDLAFQNWRAARDELRNCDTIDRVEAKVSSVGEHRHHVQALTTWQRWAQGHDVPTRALRAAFIDLARRPGIERHLATTLAGIVGTPPTERSPRLARRAGATQDSNARQTMGIER
jgi:conjugative relaxase-like TrwC/TraI family protein